MKKKLCDWNIGWKRKTSVNWWLCGAGAWRRKKAQLRVQAWSSESDEGSYPTQTFGERIDKKLLLC